MNIEEAYLALQEGQAVRRSHWGSGVFLIWRPVYMCSVEELRGLRSLSGRAKEAMVLQLEEQGVKEVVFTSYASLFSAFSGVVMNAWEPSSEDQAAQNWEVV